MEILALNTAVRNGGILFLLILHVSVTMENMKSALFNTNHSAAILAIVDPLFRVAKETHGAVCRRIIKDCVIRSLMERFSPKLVKSISTGSSEMMLCVQSP